jgi:hypothetical protein
MYSSRLMLIDGLWLMRRRAQLMPFRPIVWSYQPPRHFSNRPYSITTPYHPLQPIYYAHQLRISVSAIYYSLKTDSLVFTRTLKLHHYDFNSKTYRIIERVKFRIHFLFYRCYSLASSSFLHSSLLLSTAQITECLWQTY